jgi:energy-coupling factor transporter ATP-binding protein EcfA2
MQITGLRRGSEWRKWDLHIHSPLSALANKFPRQNDGNPDWEQYLSALEGLAGFSVLGITDYFSVDGYREVSRFKKAGRLANIDLVLPNVELRLDNLVYRTRDESEPPRRLNLHVIFSDEVPPDSIDEHFLRQLRFNFIGNPQARNEVWNASRAQIEELGRKIKSEQQSFQGSDFEVGCTVVTVDINDVKNALEGRASVFKNKYLMVLAEENLSLIRWEGQDHQIRKVLLQGADAVFSGNPDTRLWAIGKKDLNTSAFVSEFRTLKPCVHGSDAHRLDKIGRPDESRFCWIKADPTFEGLRQILFEPEDRVYIGEKPPELKHDYQVIESIEVTEAPDWFSYRPIPLNPDLVAVIGGRGTGKSALAELIAFAGGSNVFRKKAKENRENRENKDSFLYKASQKSPRNIYPITGAKILLKWKNGEPDTATIGEDLSTPLAKEKVSYLPQKFVEQLCAPENTENLEREIERVIFQRIGKTDRLGASDFKELRQAVSKAIAVKKDELRTEIEALNRSIYEGFRRTGERPTKKTQLDKKEAEHAALLRQSPSLPPENEADAKDLSRLGDIRSVIEGKIVALNENLATIEEIRALFSTFEKQAATFNSRVASLMKSVGLEAEAQGLSVRTPHTVAVAETLDGRRNDIELEIKSLSTGTTSQSLDVVNNAIAALQQKLNLSSARKEEYDKFQGDKKAIEDTIASLGREIAEIDQRLAPRLSEQRAQRLERYLDFFDVLTEERDALEKLYTPLRDALSKGGETDKKLQFVSRINFNAQEQAEKAMGLLDTRKRKCPYGSKEEIETAIKKSMTKIENFGYQRETTRSIVQELRNSFLRDSEGNEITFADQLRKDKTEEDFNNWFYDVTNFSVTYSIKFDDKDLQLLSPGQKGIVLLLVYLEVDQDDNRPLIIDQPEDNLDSLSVYASLIEYFRKRKKTRQIIIITHNPNLVVNTDAEQIVIADFDGARNPHIQYRSGALEEVSGPAQEPSIREGVCRVLEGGREAFLRREQKYALEQGAP